LIPSIHLVSKERGAEEDSIRYDIDIYRHGTPVFSRKGIFIPDSTGAVDVYDLIDLHGND